MSTELELAELEAFRDLYAAAPPAVAQELGVATLELDGGALCLAISALAGARTFNRVAGLGVPAAADDGQLAEIERFYADIEVPFVISLAPDPAPSDLGERLASRGYEADYPWVKFDREATIPDASETDLVITRIGSEWAVAFGETVARAFGLPEMMTEWIATLPERPSWSCHVALDGDQVVGAGALFVHGGVGWLGMGATVPEHRGRGAQNAILRDRIAAANAAGCRTVSTETGAQVDGRPSNSYRNILRSGFAPRYERPNLRPPGQEAL